MAVHTQLADAVKNEVEVKRALDGMKKGGMLVIAAPEVWGLTTQMANRPWATAGMSFVAGAAAGVTAVAFSDTIANAIGRK